MLTLSNLSRIEGNARQGSAFSTSMPPSNAYTHAYTATYGGEERKKRGTQPFFRGERGVFAPALWRRRAGREETGSRFPVGASRTRNCWAATQIGPAPNNRAYYRPFVSGSRVTFSLPLPPSLFFLLLLLLLRATATSPCARLVFKGLFFDLKGRGYICSGFEGKKGKGNHLSRNRLSRKRKRGRPGG